jgi:hypothetical protein
MSEKVLELQKEFFRRLACHEPPPAHSIPSLLFRMIESDDDLIEFTLGKVGKKLRILAEDIDFQHPEIFSIFDGAISNDHIFSQECIELLELGKFAKENNFKKIIPSLGKVLFKEPLVKNIVKKIDVDPNNKMHVRLLKDEKEREEIRMTKPMQIIDLKSVLKKENIWEIQPDNFKKFLRFDNSYQKDIEIAQKKYKRYQDLGCTSLANEIMKCIDSFREHIGNSYYGFNRITMTTACLILAKSLGYNFVCPKNSTGWSIQYSYGPFNAQSKIVANRIFFGKYNFNPEYILEFSHAISHFSGSNFFNHKKQEFYDYEPRVYPLHELYDIIPENLKETIALLDSFPDAGNKPIFDHFGVIVPGISFPVFNENQKIYSFLDELGIMKSYSTREEAVKSLDKIFIQGKYFHPIVVGERDFKCYFICYWS